MKFDINGIVLLVVGILTIINLMLLLVNNSISCKVNKNSLYRNIRDHFF